MELLAAIDAGASARPVLDAAVAFATAIGATVRAVHVTEDGADTPIRLAEERGVPLTLLHGDECDALLAELRREDVAACVAGTHGTLTDRPVGHVATQLLEGSSKPVLVVPFEPRLRPLRRVLVPIEGSVESVEPVPGLLRPVLEQGLEVVAVHVLTSGTAPAMLDHPDWGLEPWGSEFLERYLPEASDIDLRTGPVGRHIVAAAENAEADMVVLTWSRVLSAGRATVVREVLEHCSVPILLVPLDPDDPDADALDGVAERSVSRARPGSADR